MLSEIAASACMFLMLWIVLGPPFTLRRFNHHRPPVDRAHRPLPPPAPPRKLRPLGRTNPLNHDQKEIEDAPTEQSHR